jgi:DNA oxidative demethylase
MSRRRGAAAGDLLNVPTNGPATGQIGPGAALLRNFAQAEAPGLIAAIAAIAKEAPFRNMTTPGGYRMSVAMTNCGVGWIADRGGYRYAAEDPATGRAWPRLPSLFLALAARAAAAGGFPGFVPDGCLINRYEPGAKLSLHQDKDEPDRAAPIVSVSLGVPAIFLWGGLRRADRPSRFRLENGDIVVWGGPSRLVFHGIDTLVCTDHPLTGSHRFNLTFRKTN